MLPRTPSVLTNCLPEEMAAEHPAGGPQPDTQQSDENGGNNHLAAALNTANSFGRAFIQQNVGNGRDFRHDNLYKYLPTHLAETTCLSDETTCLSAVTNGFSDGTLSGVME